MAAPYEDVLAALDCAGVAYVVRVVGLLLGLGLLPRLPVDPCREIDLFTAEPVPVADLLRRADRLPVGSVVANVASIPDLIALKQLAGRPLT